MNPKFYLVCFAAFTALLNPTHASVLVDDSWADGSRTNQPFSVSNSIWYVSTSSAGTNAVTVTNKMMFNPSANSRMLLTYFTPTNSTQALAVGDTLKVTLNFTPFGVAPSNGSQSLRIALVNYGGTNRVGADAFSASGANGAGVTGYMLNINFGTNFGVTRPIDTRQRTNILASADLLGTLSVYERITNGPVVALGDPGFSNGVPYTFIFSAYRTNATNLVLAASFTGSGLAITNVATDLYSPTVSFDALAFRTADDVTTATNFTFTQFKVELLSGAVLVPPGFTSVVRSGNDTSLSYTGAVSQAYRLWTSTNVTLSPVTNTWSSLTNGSFASGTNTFNHVGGSTDPKRFYILSSP